jgi:putative spermidine/putrescine transport system substrate-binding protein
MFFKRNLVRGALLLLVLALLAVNVASISAQDNRTTVYVYDGADTNITDWIQQTIIPAFEKAYPQYKVNFTIARGAGADINSVVDRVQAAKQTNSDPQVDVLTFNPLSKRETIEAGLWMELTEANLPNLKFVREGAQTSPYNLPTRGSQVLIGYDSEKVKEEDVPKTFADLVTWIKANPGQFVYCRPDKGGSGSNFVVRAIYEVTGKDPSKFQAGPADPALIAMYPKAWELLREIHPFIYENGSYPAGNNPVLELLGNGSVSMASVWSDQALQAIARGNLPETIKLVQFTDLPMPGGFAYHAIPANASNPEGALAFADFLLTQEMQVSVIKEIGGFPAWDWKNLPEELQTQFTSVIAPTVPNWPGGDYGAEMVKGWYENVATNITRE